MVQCCNLKINLLFSLIMIAVTLNFLGWKFLKWKAEKFRGFILKLKSFAVELIISRNGLKDYEK